MDNRRIRYLNARLLIAQHCEGEVTRFAERLGKSQPQASTFAGEKPKKGIGPKIARQIDDTFGKPRGWLDLPHTNEWRAANLWQPETPGSGDDLSNAHSVTIRHIPVISWVAAGKLCESDILRPDEAEDWVFSSAAKTGPHSYALRVVGDSMTNPFPGGPSYPHGTIIIVDPDKRPEVGSRVVAKCRGIEATFKVYTEDGGRKLLKPLNPQYPVVEMTEDFHICGVVTGRWIDD
jgi:SOS-response transcriptional repressor LexA